MLWRKQQFRSGWNFFLGKRKCHGRRETKTARNKQNRRKHCKNLSNCAWKSSAVRGIAEQVNIDRETVSKIWTEDLDIRKVCEKTVPKELTKEQKQTRVTICKTFWRGKMTFWTMSSQVMKHGSIKMTLKWSGKVHNGRPPIPHYQKNSIGPNQESKQCCWLFFNNRGFVHYEFVPTGQTVNQVYYLEVLERLHGLGAGNGAELLKGSTLKATTVTFSNEVFSIFTDEFANFIV